MTEADISPSSSGTPGRQKSGFRGKTPVLIGVIIALVILVGVAVWLVTREGGSEGAARSFLPLAGLRQQPTEVTLKSEYTNPFDRGSQYVNPFEDYKSPFVSLQ